MPGLRQEAVTSLEEVARVLQKGKQNRTTFATNMNEHSSRSHLVVSLYVRAQDLKSGEWAALESCSCHYWGKSLNHLYVSRHGKGGCWLAGCAQLVSDGAW